MRSSTILTLLGATFAVASPLAHNHMHEKKAVVYDIVTDIVYVTVTEGELPPTPTTVHVQSTVYVNPVEASPSTTSEIKPTTSEMPTSTYVPPPPPPSTSSTTEAPAPTTEAPAPTTTEAAPVETTTQAPVVEQVASTTSPAPVASSPAASSGNSLSSTGVDNHNSCRSQHSAENVSWNETLASYAAITAATCVFAHDMTEGGGGYGQNIASQGSSSSSAWTAESALENAIISEWFSEASLFADLYGQESPTESGGDWTHFTQIVWKNSLEIGCAVQACPTSNSIFPGLYVWYTVCNYYPEGNILGEFAQNVAA